MFPEIKQFLESHLVKMIWLNVFSENFYMFISHTLVGLVNADNQLLNNIIKCANSENTASYVYFTKSLDIWVSTLDHPNQLQILTTDSSYLGNDVAPWWSRQ